MFLIAIHFFLSVWIRKIYNCKYSNSVRVCTCVAWRNILDSKRVRRSTEVRIHQEATSVEYVLRSCSLRTLIILKLQIASGSATVDLLTTIADLGGTHKFTNCRSLRPSCSVALPFDLSWKPIKLLKFEKKLVDTTVVLGVSKKSTRWYFYHRTWRKN